MRIIYRVSPFLSTHPNPLGNDKEKIVKTCLNSFLEAFDHTKHEIIFVCDSIPEEWDRYISPYGKIVDASGLGNAGTFKMQIDLAMESDERKIFLVEDDYIWRTGIDDKMGEALDHFHIVSPYDHPTHYEMQKEHELELVGGVVYRKAPSNTLTFAARKELFVDHGETMKSFGIADHPMFTHLASEGINIWVPTGYSFATHMVEGLIAPGFNL